MRCSYEAGGGWLETPGADHQDPGADHHQDLDTCAGKTAFCRARHLVAPAENGGWPAFPVELLDGGVGAVQVIAHAYVSELCLSRIHVARGKQRQTGSHSPLKWRTRGHWRAAVANEQQALRSLRSAGAAVAGCSMRCGNLCRSYNAA